MLELTKCPFCDDENMTVDYTEKGDLNLLSCYRFNCISCGAKGFMIDGNVPTPSEFAQWNIEMQRECSGDTWGNQMLTMLAYTERKQFGDAKSWAETEIPDPGEIDIPFVARILTKYRMLPKLVEQYYADPYGDSSLTYLGELLGYLLSIYEHEGIAVTLNHLYYNVERTLYLENNINGTREGMLLTWFDVEKDKWVWYNECSQ